jgi:hypothetical protein
MIGSFLDWCVERFQSIPPRTRVRVAMATLIVSVVGWPISHFTVFSEEPPGILGLSWWALILTCIDIIVTTDVREKEEEG